MPLSTPGPSNHVCYTHKCLLQTSRRPQQCWILQTIIVSCKAVTIQSKISSRLSCLRVYSGRLAQHRSSRAVCHQDTRQKACGQVVNDIFDTVCPLPQPRPSASPAWIELSWYASPVVIAANLFCVTLKLVTALSQSQQSEVNWDASVAIVLWDFAGQYLSNNVFTDSKS